MFAHVVVLFELYNCRKGQSHSVYCVTDYGLVQVD